MIIRPVPIRILYSAALRGQLELLPRLHTYFSAQRQTAPGISVLVDLGQSCAAGVWICQSTSGRGMLVAMDALGYDAFHIGQADALYHFPQLVNQIKQVIVTPLAAGQWTASLQRGGIKIRICNGKNLELIANDRPDTVDLILGLGLGSAPEVKPIWKAPCRLLSVVGGESESLILGQVDITLLPDPPYIQIEENRMLTLPPETLPNPTITGVIDFVISEARQAERKRGQA